jgi:glucan phosphoethanolaminetransferase (alkaline phosphatase superfamily)
MAKLFETLGKQWHDIKGNAKWDFIKWSIYFVTFAPSLFLGFVRHAPLWQIILVFFGTIILVAALIVTILLILSKIVPSKTQSNQLESYHQVGRMEFRNPLHAIAINNGRK